MCIGASACASLRLLRYCFQDAMGITHEEPPDARISSFKLRNRLPLMRCLDSPTRSCTCSCACLIENFHRINVVYRCQVAIWCSDNTQKKPLQPFSDLASHSSWKHLRPATWLITKAPLAMQRLGDVYRDRNPTWVDCESQGRGDVTRKTIRVVRTDRPLEDDYLQFRAVG